ncbi:MAG: type I-B CRISPR-associated protein Cas7/Csh2 [bacterium]
MLQQNDPKSNNGGVPDVIKNRNEFLFIYDIKNGNPNGDPDENRPRIEDVSKKCYVTDVRLKRFIRDYLIQTDGINSILVAKTGEKTNNLTDRVKEHLVSVDIKKIEGQALLDLFLTTYTDLRFFGSPLALTDGEWKEKTKSLTGSIQINFGETLHEVEECTFHGWGSVTHESGQGGSTPTTYYGIHYGLIAFHGVANENAAKTTKLSQADMDKFKIALWKGVRESTSANTRTKKEQQPRLLLNIIYKEKIKITDTNNKEEEVPTEYHIGSLEEKIELKSRVGEQINIKTVNDYTLDPTKLLKAIGKVKDKIEQIEYCMSPEFEKDIFTKDLVEELKSIAKKDSQEGFYFKVVNLNIDRISTGA